MSVLSFITDIFKPAVDLIDELNFSGEEKGQLEIKKAQIKHKIAELENKVMSQVLTLQQSIVEANSKLEMAIQQHGNWYTKAVRPTINLGNWIIVLLMAFKAIEYNREILIFCGGYNAHYTHARKEEKKAGVTR